ncbi:MAG: hypothetical protein J0L82_18160 [Deltaproteobacteria bacterium]|jgi:hypothetical protein|nr:hypothetical protein [Deltaproteobacteria bacterium]
MVATPKQEIVRRKVMKEICLSTLTIEQMERLDIRPVNVEDHTEELINQCFPDVLLLDQYTRQQGSLIRQTDEVMFRMCCRDGESNNVEDKLWMEIDGQFYEVETVIQKFIEAGFEVENDL